MNTFIQLKCKPKNHELEKIYNEYLARTQYAMHNFIILRAVSEVLINHLPNIDIIPKSELDKINGLLIASDNYPLSWTTKTDLETLWQEAKNEKLMSHISYSVLVELVAALDEAMVKITELFLPNMDLAMLKKKKFSSSNFTITSKTLIYPYVVFRHCYKDKNTLPLLFSDHTVIPWINTTILLRHMIIHNDAKFDTKEESSVLKIKFTTQRHEDNSLRFDKNDIDVIFNHHANNLANFICWLDTDAEVNYSSDFTPKIEPQTFRKSTY